MNKLTTIAAVSFVLLLLAVPAFAAEDTAATSGDALEPWAAIFGVTFGAALIIVAASYGISKIGAAAVENMARQPETAADIQAAMVISAALIEGVTFFGLIICILSLYS